jgi:hypothetical protein
LRKSFRKIKGKMIGEKEDGIRKVCKVCTWWTRSARKVRTSDEKGPGNVNLLKGTVP